MRKDLYLFACAMQNVVINGVHMQVLADPAQGLRYWRYFGPFRAMPVITFAMPELEDRMTSRVARIAMYAMCIASKASQGPTHTTDLEGEPLDRPFALIMPACNICGMHTANWCVGCENHHQVLSTALCHDCENHGRVCTICGFAEA